MSKPVNALVLCVEKIPSVELGVLRLFKYLKTKKDFDYVYRNSFEIKHSDFIEADVIVFIRSTTYFELEIAKLARVHKKFLIYFLDDDLLNLPKESISYSYLEIDHVRNNVRNNMKNIMRECDLLWTNSFNIEQKYNLFFHRKIRIDVPYKIVQERSKQQKESVKILFAGSPDHFNYTNKLLENVVKILTQKYNENIKFVFVGGKPNFVENFSQIESYPYTIDYGEYLELIKKLTPDFGLAPLQNGDFYRCKYFNKYLEYTSLGIVGLYSNSEPYTFIVNNMDNGVLCENISDSWVEKLSYLIENPEIGNDIYKNAADLLKEKFNYEIILEDFLNQLPEIISFHAIETDSDIRLKLFFFVRRSTLVNRIINKYKEVGFLDFWKKAWTKISKHF